MQKPLARTLSARRLFSFLRAAPDFADPGRGPRRPASLSCPIKEEPVSNPRPRPKNTPVEPRFAEKCISPGLD
jgi:hypothetical protein